MRARLALLVLATTSLMMIAFLIPLALLVRQVAADRATLGATADIQGIVTVVGTAEAPALQLAAEQLAAESGRPVSVYLADGRVLGTPAEHTPAVLLAARGQSLTAADDDGDREIVVAVQGRPEGAAVIRTLVPAEQVRHGVTRSWLVLSGLGVLLVLLALAVADRLARALIRPIGELSAVSHRLANAELTARATPDGPAETREVARALNHLAGRIQDLLAQEREKAADLSHRLRTPLTALRLETELLGDEEEHRRVNGAVDDLERAVTGLIRQVRHRPAQGRCDAGEVVRDRAAFWSVLAEDTGRLMDVRIDDGPHPVALPAEDLAAALDALLNNIFAHTPDTTGFTIALTGGDEVVLTVADEGPGMPPDLAGRGVSGGDSTGLGLDIARRAAEAAGGHLQIRTSSPGGAVVELHLGSGR